MGRIHRPSIDNCSDSSDIASCCHTHSIDPPWPFNMKGKPSDVPAPKGKVAQQISDLLGQVQNDEFCFGGLAYLLPVLPGLKVSSIGTVSLPLRGEMVEQLKLQAREEQFQSWTIPASQVAMQNPEWGSGIAVLCAFIAEKLGYKDIALLPRLTRVLVCGPRGCVERLPGVVTGRCVATLVVQPPSEYTGGDLLVSRAGAKNKARYELGNTAAAFRPHYVVYTAGSSCCVERVTTGYRITMEYQLLLPAQVPFDWCKRARLSLSGKLADALKQLKAGPDDIGAIEEEPTPGNLESDTSDTGDDGEILAFVLSNSYNRMLLYKGGWEVLSGVDRVRFQFLKDANSLLPPDKQLRFYFANSHFMTELTKTKEVVVWRSITGAVVGNGSGTALSKPFNFLNPDNESLSQLWDNTRKSTMPECERVAIAMWPSSADIVNQVGLMGIAAAIPTILLRDALSDATVQMLLKNDVLGSYNFALAVQSSKSPIQLLLFCQKLVPAIIKVGDVKLVKSFLKNISIC